MIVAIVNRGFLDYRVPVFEELDRLLDGNLWVLCSSEITPDRVTQRLEKTLGSRLITFENELVMGQRGGVSSEFANRSLRVPYQPGLMKRLGAIKPDIVIAEGFFQWTWMAVLYRIRYKKKLLLSYERTAHTERNAQWYRILFRKIVAQFVSGYAVNGSLTADYLKQLGISDRPIVTGQMAADTEQIQQVARNIPDSEKQVKRQEFLGNRTGRIFFSAGQLIKRKGYAELLAAWATYGTHWPNEDVLLIAGQGPEAVRLEQIIAERAIEGVYLLGAVTYDDMPIYYAMADIFVLPTLEDNWSLVIPEAMACGLPIITTTSNGCWPELVHSENGKSVDPIDQEAFARAFYELQNADLDEMGRRSKQIVKNFTPRAAAERIFALCRLVEKQSAQEQDAVSC